MDKHRTWIAQALELAGQAAARGDAPVGCIVVRDDVVVGSGFNRREDGRSALAHAELVAIEEACRTLGGWRLHGCTLAVTLEPCAMCAGAIANARISKVVFGAYDPKAGAYGGLFDLRTMGLNHTPDVTGGVMADECGAVLKAFFSKLR